jgi:hypothetical protein
MQSAAPDEVLPEWLLRFPPGRFARHADVLQQMIVEFQQQAVLSGFLQLDHQLPSPRANEPGTKSGPQARKPRPAYGRNRHTRIND